MKLKKISRVLSKILLAATAAGTCVSSVMADPANIPFHKQKYTFDSGRINGNERALVSGPVRHVISIPEAPWLQLNLQGTVLGQNSYLEITSLYDGASQIINAQALTQWNFQSAYFNGDSIEVKLYIDPDDRNVELKVGEVTVGEFANRVQPLSICGVDDRIASSETRVARIDPIGCTGWVIDTGQQLTAGHCLAGSGNNTLSFNPPQSLPDGTVQFPGPEDQYSIDQSSFNFTNGGVGNDWGTFAVFNNAQTGLQPIAAQGSFSIKQDLNPANIRITGFGVDSGSTNQTNQTHVGPNAGSSGTTMRYTADTQGGNSGSPVIDEATGEAVGIHTHGGCSSSGGNNNGTSFFNTALWNAIDDITPPPPLTCPAGSIDFNSLTLTSYSNQNNTNDTSVGDGGDSITLTGNTWVRSTQSFNITPTTVLEFMFASSSQGEIHAIGFENNDTLNDDPRHFQFWGTQNWTGVGKIDLTPKYSGGGDYQTYSIPVGQSYTGNMFLALTNDKDSGTLNNQSQFACVRIIDEEPPACDVEESFESGMGGWTTGGSCSTGTFTTGTPDEVVNGGVTTQVAGAQSGSSALFTQPNTGGAGTDDVDGGECVATSPAYDVTANSDVSLYYFHGQRDAGDDANDGFNLEVSVNGGSFQSLASFGDVTSNAAWTLESFTANAGDTLQFQVRASDAAGAGDLVEAGVDNLKICAQ